MMLPNLGYQKVRRNKLILEKVESSTKITVCCDKGYVHFNVVCVKSMTVKSQNLVINGKIILKKVDAQTHGF